MLSEEFDLLQRAVAGRYSVVEEIGRGGMGVVFAARDVALDRPVAIKLLPPALAATDESRRRFLREARTAASLSHPHIVPIHAVEERDGLVFFVMALVDGESLGQRIRRLGPMPSRAALRVVQEVAWALAHAHARGVVHRDVKPDNILLERDGDRALVTDFGIAFAAGRQTPVDGVTLGTPAYMSPEQGRGEEPDGRSDLYALGVTAWMAFAGRLPFPGPSAAAFITQHASLPVPSLAEAVPSLPLHVATAIDRCLAKDPVERWPDAEDLAQALSIERARLPVVPPPVRAFLREWDRAGAEFVTAGTAAAASGLVGLALAFWPDHGISWSVALNMELLSALYIGTSVLVGGLAIERLAHLARHARILLRAGYAARSLPSAIAMGRPERDEEARSVESGAGRAGWLPGGVALAIGAASTWGMWQTGSGSFVTIILATASVVAPTMAVRSWWTLLRRKNPEGLWSRLAGGWLGRALFRVAGVGLGPVQRARLEDGEPTVRGLGERARQVFAALTAADREVLREVPALLDRLEVEAMALRAAPESAPGAVRFAQATAAMELLRLDLMKLAAGRAGPGELTSAVELAREIGRRVDAIVEVGDVSRG
ncbi:MAG: serine/threonine-protein kinase [Gemmatimonadaceae bacterium]